MQKEVSIVTNSLICFNESLPRTFLMKSKAGMCKLMLSVDSIHNATSVVENMLLISLFSFVRITVETFSESNILNTVNASTNELTYFCGFMMLLCIN